MCVSVYMLLPLVDRVNDLKMEDIAFSDWPGQPVDLNNGNNPWLPAYGFQTPATLLEREDFIGNPGLYHAYRCRTYFIGILMKGYL